MPGRIDTPVALPARTSTLSPGARSWLRRSLIFACITPMTVLLATRLANLGVDPLLGTYAVLTLCTFTAVAYLAFACYADPSDPAPAWSPPPLVSCLVAARDEEQNIERCVRSLLNSTHRPIEVIAIDDGSRDSTAELLTALASESDGLEVVLLAESVGKKRALTRGVQHARGEIIVFTDSDCVVAPDAVERVVRAFAADPEIGAVSGHARALNAERNLLTRVQDTWYEGQFSVWKAAESVFGSVSCISGPLAAFRREAIWNYFPAWAEDRFLGREFPFATDRQLTAYVLAQDRVGSRLQRRYADSDFLRVQHPPRRWRIEYVRSATVQTIVPHTLRRLIRQQVRWKKSFIRNLCFTGRFYWRRGVVPALLFYSHVIFVIAMPFMALRHLVWLPLDGAWGLSALYFCGVTVKGFAWGLAYKARNPGCHRWVYRPLMSLMTATLFSPLLLYSALTLRKPVWVRG